MAARTKTQGKVKFEMVIYCLFFLPSALLKYNWQKLYILKVQRGVNIINALGNYDNQAN